MDKPHEAIAYYKGIPPVGGITIPINKPTFVSTNIFTLLDTWISLALTLIYAAAGTAILVHLKKKRK
jgi:ABC-type glycerol-3-phosphate transport system permease component